MTNYLETGVVVHKEDGIDEVYYIPYNINNILITQEEIIQILNRYNVRIDKINHIEYFHQSFTHKSYIKKDIFTDEILKCARIEMNNPKNLMELRNDSYERLEYFGDRVVKIVVSFYLFNRYPQEDEGFMTRLQTKIEDKKNLSILSKELGFGKFFIISKQIELQNGRNMEKIHEDVFEAFMGALFLSNGLEPCLILLLNLLETMIDYSNKLYCDNNYKDNLLRYHHKMKWKFPEYHMIGYDGPPHKRNYIMGVENPKISSVSKKTFIKTKNWKELCISFGYGLSKREGEQKAAKMSLILHEQLNEDQFTSSDVYYPSFNMKSKKKADTTSEDSGDSDDSGDSGDSNESDSAEQETETELETETKSKSKSEYKSDDMEDDINSNITESEIEDSD
jgi:ribonuclease-3